MNIHASVAKVFTAVVARTTRPQHAASAPWGRDERLHGHRCRTRLHGSDDEHNWHQLAACRQAARIHAAERLWHLPDDRLRAGRYDLLLLCAAVVSGAFRRALPRRQPTACAAPAWRRDQATRRGSDCACGVRRCPLSGKQHSGPAEVDPRRAASARKRQRLLLLATIRGAVASPASLRFACATPGNAPLLLAFSSSCLLAHACIARSQVCIASLAGAWILRAPSRPSAAPCFSLIAGLFGGSTVLTAKLVGELAGAGAPSTVLAVIAPLIGVCAVSQISVLNAGVGRHSSLVVVPVFVATFVSANAIGGTFCCGSTLYDTIGVLTSRWRNAMSCCRVGVCRRNILRGICSLLGRADAELHAGWGATRDRRHLPRLQRTGGRRGGGGEEAAVALCL